MFSFLSKVQAQAGSLLNAVATLIGATEAEEREKALEALRGIIVQQHSDFDNNDMHDAQEFLTVLLQNLAVSFFFARKLSATEIQGCFSAQNEVFKRKIETISYKELFLTSFIISHNFIVFPKIPSGLP